MSLIVARSVAASLTPVAASVAQFFATMLRPLTVTTVVQAPLEIRRVVITTVLPIRKPVPRESGRSLHVYVRTWAMPVRATRIARRRRCGRCRRMRAGRRDERADDALRLRGERNGLGRGNERGTADIVAANPADQGMIVPLFMIPFGSNACFSVSSIGNDEPYSSLTHGARALPMPWWWTIEPPRASVSSQMIEMIGR